MALDGATKVSVRRWVAAVHGSIARRFEGRSASRLAQRGRADLVEGRHALALEHLVRAVERQPSDAALRAELLTCAAMAGNRDVFYDHLNDEVDGYWTDAQLSAALETLGDACKAAGDWRSAADAYHHAFTLDREVPTKKAKYFKARRLAPDWGFYSRDLERIWRLDENAAVQGVVAPIRSVLFGWLPVSLGTDLVSFKLNDVTIADTHAVTQVTLPDGNRYLQFSRQLKDLWGYAGKGDELAIEASGRPLAIIGRGRKFRFGKKTSRASELFTKVDDGFVFNKYGRLRPSIQGNEGWQEGMFDLYQKLQHDIAEGVGLRIFPFYGTALGAVREGNFISHDNDFDTVYISEHSDPVQVQKEFKELCSYLISRGYDLKVKATHTWVKSADTSDKLDIFFAWFNPEGLLDVSYGYHGEQVRRSEEFFEFRDEKLGPFEISVPSNIEDILSQLYGPSWRTPDPGFAHLASTREMDKRYHLSTSDVTDLYWNQFYRDHELDRASTFAEFVSTRFSNPGTLLEFGSGSGGDGVFFAKHGWTAFCGDRSPEALARANDIANASGGRLLATFSTVDVTSPDDVRAFIESVRGSEVAGPLVVYMRFFLHAIDERAQTSLLDALTNELDREFYLCVEFRTIEDRNRTKVHRSHFRRYIDHERFAVQLQERWSFEVELVEASTGLSPFDGEDPHLARIIARHG